MVALNFDAICIDSPARSTALFEFGGERLEARSCTPEPAYYGDALTLAPLRLAADSRDPIPCFPGCALAADAFAYRSQAVGTAPADAR